MRGNYVKKAGRLDLSELAVVTPYGKVEGNGPITDLAGTPRFDLKGTLSPDWKVLTDLLAKKVEPNASIAGTPRAGSSRARFRARARARRTCSPRSRARSG